MIACLIELRKFHVMIIPFLAVVALENESFRNRFISTNEQLSASLTSYRSLA